MSKQDGLSGWQKAIREELASTAAPQAGPIPPVDAVPGGEAADESYQRGFNRALELCATPAEGLEPVAELRTLLCELGNKVQASDWRLAERAFAMSARMLAPTAPAAPAEPRQEASQVEASEAAKP